MTNQDLIKLLQDAEMDLYEMGEDETIPPMNKIGEVINELERRRRKDARAAA